MEPFQETPHGARTDRYPIGPAAVKLSKAPRDKAKRTGQGEKLQSSQRFFGESHTFEGMEYNYSRVTYWVRYANRHDKRALRAVLAELTTGVLTETWHDNRVYLSLTGGCARLSVVDMALPGDTDTLTGQKTTILGESIAISLTAANDVHKDFLTFSGLIGIEYGRSTVPYGANKLGAKPAVKVIDYHDSQLDPNADFTPVIIVKAQKPPSPPKGDEKDERESAQTAIVESKYSDIPVTQADCDDVTVKPLPYPQNDDYRLPSIPNVFYWGEGI